jgi:hypothetical protein
MNAPSKVVASVTVNSIFALFNRSQWQKYEGNEDRSWLKKSHFFEFPPAMSATNNSH